MSLHLNSESAFILSHIRHPEFNFRLSILNAHVRPHGTENGKQDGKYDCRCYKTYKSKREGSRIFLNPVSFLFVSSVIRRALRSRKRGSRPLSIPTWIMRARAVSPKDLSMLWAKSPPLSISFLFSAILLLRRRYPLCPLYRQGRRTRFSRFSKVPTGQASHG